jgi:hypothetical protein
MQSKIAFIIGGLAIGAFVGYEFSRHLHLTPPYSYLYKAMHPAAASVQETADDLATGAETALHNLTFGLF